MNRTLRAIIGVILVGIIVFSISSILHTSGSVLRFDITDEKLYTLSEGTRTIVAKLHQPMTLKLYFSRTVSFKAPDQIQYYNNYYTFVKTLLEEYVRISDGMIKLEIIDPLPFSDDEEDALRSGLQRFMITEEENFFFGLVLITEFGVVKQIPFFTPERDNFVEYDVTRLIDSAMTREKKRIGILSSLPVMGDDASGYMAQLRRMQGQPLAPAWKIVQELQQRYSVQRVAADVEEITDVDMLLVIHPKDFPEKTLFAIDQFVMKGGRVIFCLDPHSFAEQPDPMQQQNQLMPRNSNLNQLLKTWGVEMAENQFAGDRALAVDVKLRQQEPLQTLIGYLKLDRPECYNQENVVTAQLQEVTMLFAGALKAVEITGETSEGVQPTSTFIPLLSTTNRGNTWEVEGVHELLFLDPRNLMHKFQDGTEPVVMGALVTGRFASNFPDGIDITEEIDEEQPAQEGEGEKKTTTRHLDGVAMAEEDGAIAVFADVDFLSDMLAYQQSFFGLSVSVGNNSDLLINTIDDLSGSSDLIGLRTRGNFQRPFMVVEQIRQEAEQQMAEEELAIQAEIDQFNQELQSLAATQQNEEQDLIEASILKKRQELELKIHQAERKLRQVHMKRRARIDALGRQLQNVNSLLAPVVILCIGIAVDVRRRILRHRHIRKLREN